MSLLRTECDDELASWIEGYWELRWEMPTLNQGYSGATTAHPIDIAVRKLASKNAIRVEGYANKQLFDVF